MSQTLYAEFRGRGFWVFDIVSGVLLKHLVDAAVPRLGAPTQAWLSDAVARWRFNAVVSDCGLFLDDNWSAEQIRTFTELAAEACEALSKRLEITADEIASWPMVDDLSVFPRGLPSVDTASVIRLGRAIIELVNETLPEPPPGTWWFFGTAGSARTLKKRE